MKTSFRLRLAAAICLPLNLLLGGCDEGKPDTKAEAPPAASVEPDLNANNFKVDHPELFPLATATERKAVPALNVTGLVQPDIARAVPVISLASGRVVEIDARLGDVVKKGQLLLKVRSNDISGAYQSYLKAVNDERLARIQLERAQILYDKGATAKSALEAAQNTEQDAQVDLNAALELLRTMGVDKEHPSAVVEIRAPISGVITDQQVTNAAGVQGLGAPNPFTVSDLSYVWIICDVYENDLDAVHVGEYADIRLNAYPNRAVRGRIDNILPILDPNIHTAKVRIEVPNSGLMRIGMFVTATFYGRQPVVRAVVPSSAILHLHDRDWVYLPLGGAHFKRQEVVTGNILPGNIQEVIPGLKPAGHSKRQEVVTGNMLPGDVQEVISGLKPGDQVVSNALALQNTVEQ